MSIRAVAGAAVGVTFLLALAAEAPIDANRSHDTAEASGQWLEHGIRFSVDESAAACAGGEIRLHRLFSLFCFSAVEGRE